MLLNLSHNKKFKADTRSSRVRFNSLLCGRPHWGACISREVHLFLFYKGKNMDDLEKRKIYNFIQLALQSFQSNKFQINTYSPYYAVNGTSGIKFSVKVNETDLAFFAGFSTDKKYEGKLLFGILI